MFLLSISTVEAAIEFESMMHTSEMFQVCSVCLFIVVGYERDDLKCKVRCTEAERDL